MAESQELSHVYSKNCSKVLSNSPIMQCSQCKTTKYCSKACQNEHWKCHKAINVAIKQAESYFDDVYLPKTMYMSHLTHQDHKKLVSLVGVKCLINC